MMFCFVRARLGLPTDLTACFQKLFIAFATKGAYLGAHYSSRFLKIHAKILILALPQSCYFYLITQSIKTKPTLKQPSKRFASSNFLFRNAMKNSSPNPNPDFFRQIHHRHRIHRRAVVARDGVEIVERQPILFARRAFQNQTARQLITMNR